MIGNILHSPMQVPLRDGCKIRWAEAETRTPAWYWILYEPFTALTRPLTSSSVRSMTSL